MKTKCIFILALVALASCKTTGVSKTVASKQEPLKVGDFAQPTLNKDTLYLLESDPLAIQTHQIWLSDTVEKFKPAIVFVNQQEMMCIKKRCNDKSKEIN